MKKKLNDISLRALKPKEKRWSCHDQLCPGLEVRVMPSGTKSFSATSRVGARVRRKLLGHYPGMTLQDARTQALAQQRDWQHEADLTTQPDPLQALPSVAEALGQFCEQHRSSSDNGNDVKQLLSYDLLPLIGSLRVDQPTRLHFLEMLDRIQKRAQQRHNGQYMGVHRARKVFGAARVLYRWITHHYGLPVDPTASVDLSIALPQVPRQRSRVLSAAELPILWAATERLSDRQRIALQLLILTCKRRGEVVDAQRSEFSGDVWTIPATRSKKGREQVVPLSTQAQQLIAESRQLWPWSRYVLPSRQRCNGDRPISKTWLSSIITRNRDAWGLPGIRLHDARRNVSHLSRRGVRRSVIREILGHRPSGAASHYLWMAPLDDMRAALQDWADYLDQLTVQITEEETP